MARLRNRMVKAEFWTDPELLRWHRDKRTTYKGLWALAEDSACLEDDPFGWKLLLWPSPVDADITIEVLERWRDEFIEAGKLIPYEAEGKRYLYLRNFHDHERPRNPQRPNLPLPEWLRYETQEVQRRDGRTNLVTTYRVVTESVPNGYRPPTESLVPSSPVPSSPVPSIPVGGGKEEAPPTFDPANPVAYLARYAKTKSVPLDDKVKKRLGKEALEQIKARAAPEHVAWALEVMVDESKSPDLLGAVVRDFAVGRREHHDHDAEEEWVRVCRETAL